MISVFKKHQLNKTHRQALIWNEAIDLQDKILVLLESGDINFEQSKDLFDATSYTYREYNELISFLFDRRFKSVANWCRSRIVAADEIASL